MARLNGRSVMHVDFVSIDGSVQAVAYKNGAIDLILHIEEGCWFVHVIPGGGSPSWAIPGSRILLMHFL